MASTSVFATGSLAARIERAEATMISEGVAATKRRLPPGQAFARPLAGGVAAFTEPGSPFNKVAGLGFDGVPDVDALEAIESEFLVRECPVQVELASLGDPGITRQLTRRGYELIGFENVLGLALDREDWAESTAGTSIRVDAARDDENAAWMDTVTTGFLTPDVFDGPPSHESFEREVLERVFGDTIATPGFERFLARRDGVVAGGASLRVYDGVAQLCGAATLPGHRRQGVQTALLRHRLADAARRGCDVAVVTTQPGSKSQQNVQRFGFSLLYVRAILIKNPNP